MLVLGTVLLLALSTDSIATQQPGLSVRQVYGRQRTLARLQQDDLMNICAGAGHVGCCIQSCAVQKPDGSGICYCSRDCYGFDDCCDGILENGCPETAMCSDLPSIPNGVITYSDSSKTVNTVATYSCNDGYALSYGDTMRTCQEYGWTGSPPTCEVISCMIKYPDTGCTTDPSQPLLGGDFPNPRCSCHASCFTNGFLCCEDIGCVRTCSDLPSIPNGVIMYSDSSKSVNTAATYSCNVGYTLYNGDTMRTCQESGWTGSPPICEGVCPVLPPLTDGTVTYTNSNRRIRTVAIYTCNEGYRLNGKDRRICQGSTGWSGVALEPVCKVASCMVKFPGTGCTTDPSQSLLGGDFPNPRCSCHASCFTSDFNCCEDIGCAPTTCVQAGLSQGCCSWDPALETQGLTGCYLPGGECYCDSECQAAGDCCTDVPSMPTCTQSILSLPRDQSLRVKPFGRAQFGGDHPRHLSPTSFSSQASRNLASELKSMTQEVVENKNRWEIIANKLENIRKQKNLN